MTKQRALDPTGVTHVVLKDYDQGEIVMVCGFWFAWAHWAKHHYPNEAQRAARSATMTMADVSCLQCIGDE